MSVELRSVRRLFSAGVTRLSASDGPGWHLASVGIVTAGRWFVGGFGARCNHGIIYMTVRLAPHGRAWHGMAWPGTVLVRVRVLCTANMAGLCCSKREHNLAEERNDVTGRALSPFSLKRRR